MAAILPEISPPSSPDVAENRPLGASRSSPTLLQEGNRRDGPQRQRGSAASRAAFLERQLKHSGTEARMHIAKLHKQLVKDERNADEAEFWGAKGKEGFKRYLEKRFGSTLAGWRVLDHARLGRISKGELCHVCRIIGFHGNLKQLWDELDVKKKDFITLHDIDEEVGHYVSSFKLALMNKYGDMLVAWKKGIDTNGTGRVEEQEVGAALKRLNLTELRPKKLYRMLVGGKIGGGLTLLELDPDAYTRYVSGDKQGLTLKANKEFLDDIEEKDMPEDVKQHEHGVSGGVTKFRQKLMKEERQDHFKELAKLRGTKAGLHTADGFKQTLVQRFGSLLNAWDKGLDLDGNGRLTFGEFCIALDRLGLFGDVKGLWRELLKLEPEKKDSELTMGYLLFGDLDPKTDCQLREMKAKLAERHGNMLVAWMKGLDQSGSGMVNEEQFFKGCVDAGYAENPRQLFRKMKPGKQAHLTLSEFDKKAYLAFSRGDFRMLSEMELPTFGKKPLEMTFDERNESGFYFQVRRSWDISQREDFRSSCRTTTDLRPVEQIESFEELCLRKFGSMPAAWRQALDPTGIGKLSFAEFCQGLRRLGYAGDFRYVWREAGGERTGMVSLQAIDSGSHQRIESFLSLLKERYEDLETAWKFGFAKDPHGTIEKEELLEACTSLGYPHNAEELFQDLCPVPGRTALSIWDIDPTCSKQRSKGLKAILPGKSAPPPTSQEGPEPKSEAPSPTNGAKGASASEPRQQLKNLLRTKFGSTAAAWRMEIDPKWTGCIHSGQFLLLLDKFCFNGSPKKLWEELSNGRPVVTYEDIDPEGFKALAKFRSLLIEGFGWLAKAWEEGLDVDRLGRLDLEEWLRSTQELSIPDKLAKRVFKLCLARQGQRSLTCEDLQMLLIGVHQDDMGALWAGPGISTSPTAASEAKPKPTPGMVKLHDGSPRTHAEEVTNLHHSKDVNVRDLDRFKQLLTTQYGSLWAAWRQGMDHDKNGIVTQADFGRACQFLGIKAINKLWTGLDTLQLGYITLKELDPEVAELFAELEKRLLENFPNRKEGWKAVFDSENRLHCDLQAWKSGCTRLDFRGGKGRTGGGAERLFKLLKPEPGRSQLTYDDLWVDDDPNDFTKLPAA